MYRRGGIGVAQHTSEVALVMAPRRRLISDMKHNRWWILGLLGTVVLYILVSAAVILRYQPTWRYRHALYFTTINVTTVGFGDVAPSHPVSKLIAGVNAFVGLGLFGVLVAVIALAFQPGDLIGSATVTTTSDISRSDGSIEEAVRGLIRAVKARISHEPPEESSGRDSRELMLRIDLHDDHAHIIIDLRAG